jgi:hypothetical protein
MASFQNSSLKRVVVGSISLILAGFASGQEVERVFNRDTEEDFAIKGIDLKTRVIGPIVRSRTVFSYANPFKKLTEATVHMTLPSGAVLGSFAYWYKNEYVPGMLMDKNKAWFIYTAITSRDKDPGIMEQYDAQNYHAQIYPLAVGYDLRLELLSIGFLEPGKAGLVIPYPEAGELKPRSWTLYGLDPAVLRDGRTIPDEDPSKPLSIDMHAQRFKDRRYYVAGIVRSKEYREPKIKGLRNLYLIPDPMGGAYNFVGWMRRPGPVQIKLGSLTKTMKVHGYDKGSDTAKLWAHQRLAQGTFERRREALNFSLKYGIPSAVTALLAVPQQEMKLFRKKAAEYKRKQREIERRDRDWSEEQGQNWRNTQGGDPEIRVHYPNAEKVYAILPDGRVLDLRPTGKGYWGGSYDVPTTAAEGEYQIRIVAVNRDGVRQETKLEYTVDRTAPDGRVEVDIEKGRLKITVRSEKDLARVTAYMPDGTEVTLEESKREPGLYTASVRRPVGSGTIRVVLLDHAHNRNELRCSW